MTAPTSPTPAPAYPDRPSIGIIGSGHIGSNLARLLVKAGHTVTVSFSKDPGKPAKLADDIGATAADPATAARSDVVVISVPFAIVDNAIEQAGGPVDRGADGV
jgi:predicted dinucleotide-binding enzyme